MDNRHANRHNKNQGAREDISTPNENEIKRGRTNMKEILNLDLKDSLAMRIFRDVQSVLSARVGEENTKLKRYLDMAEGDLRRGDISEDTAKGIALDIRNALWAKDETEEAELIKKVEGILKIR